jgi:Carboxypeptidase regulatory-like domain/TonB dependent receptor
MRCFASYAVSLFLSLCWLMFPAGAQTATGSARGTVVDESKAIIPGARVTIANKEIGAERATVTNSAGEYQFPSLAPGEYEIRVAAKGFKTHLTVLTLQVGESYTGDVTMEIGAASETVVITGETPALNVSEYKVDGVVNRRQIENLPLNGRNFLQLAMLEPGVAVEAVDNPGTSPNNFFRVSIAGASQALTRISVDGATINDRVTGGTSQNFSQESVQEFQISTFNQDVSNSVSGVGSVNMVSRSGSNDLHGSGFLYYRDNNMAADPRLRRTGRTPSFQRRQMGGSLGGPIVKDRFHYFVNYEYQNQDGVQPVTNRNPIFSQFDTAPSNPLNFDQANVKLDYRLNDNHNTFFRFSSDNNDNYNSANGTFLPSNWVVTKNASTQGVWGLTSVLTPKMTNDVRVSYGFYSGRLNVPTTDDCKDAFGCLGLGGPRISTTGSSFVIGNNLNTPQNRVLRTYQVTDTLSWQKSSHRVRVGGEWEHFYGQGHWAYLEPAFVTLWDPVSIVQVIAVTGGPQASPFVPLYNSLPDSLKLNYSLSAGGLTINGPLRPGLRPTYNEILQLPLAGFATGVGDPGQPQAFNFGEAAHNNRYRLFVADQWRVNNRFTLSAGLAYVYEDKLMNHDFNRPQILSALLGGDLRNPPRDRNNFDPSLGFAWDVTGKGRTVIRGGAGIYHDSNLFWTRLVERAYTGPSGNGRYIIPGEFFTVPNVGRLLFDRTPTNFRGANLMQILPALRAGIQSQIGTGKDLSVRGIEVFKTSGDRGFGGINDPGTVTPYSINLTGGIQHEVAPNMVFQADFVMRRSLKFGGLHDTFIYDRNRFNSLNGPVLPRCAPENAFNPRAICSNGAINVSHSGAMFRYTGLHLKLDKRFTNRYLFVASYALSRFMGHNGIINLDNLYEADDYQGSDRTHRLTFSGVMELPKYGGGNRLAKAVLNTWTVSLISQTVSRPPLSLAIGGVDLDGDGINTLILPGATFRGFGRNVDKAELTNLVENFNQTLAGTRTSRGQNIPRITLPATEFNSGDTFWSQDLRLTRSFSLTEKLALQFIGEAFNLFNVSNTVGFGGLNSVCEDDPRSCFGKPSNRAGGVFGTGGPRAFQLAARLRF